ncbi:MAG: HEAT repeat domain-containing protein [Fusobacteriota bacterium]
MKGSDIRTTLYKTMYKDDSEKLNDIIKKISENKEWQQKTLAFLKHDGKVLQYILTETEDKTNFLMQIRETFKQTDWYKKIQRHLTHPDKNVRLFFLQEIGKAKTEIFSNILVDMLKDPNSFLRSEVANILAKYETDTSMKLLVSMLDDNSRKVVQDVTLLLAKKGEKVLPYLDKYLKLPLKKIKLNILELLNRIKSSKSLKYLAIFCTDSNEEVKIKAQHILILFFEKLKIDPNSKQGEKIADILRDEIGKVSISNISNILKVLLKLNSKGAKVILQDLENKWGQKRDYIKLLKNLNSNKYIYLIIEMLKSDFNEIRELGLEFLENLKISSGDTNDVLSLLSDYIINRIDNITDKERELINGFIRENKLAEKVLPKIRSDNKETRKIAVALIGIIGDPKLYSLLINRLQDPSSIVRTATLKILSQEKNDEYLNYYKRLLHDPEEKVQKAAIEAIIKLESKEAKDIIVSNIDHPNETIRNLIKNKLANENLQKYIEEFNNLKLSEKENIASLLNKMPEKTAQILEKKMDSVDETGRYDVVEILKYLEDKKEYVDLYIKGLRDPNKEIRASIVTIFEKCKNRKILIELLKLLNDPDNRVRANVVETFGRIENKTAVKILKPFSKDDDNRIRANAIMSLYKLGYKKVLSELDDMVKSDSEYMKASAVYVIRNLELKDKVDLLLKLKDESSILIKKNLIKAFYQLEQRQYIVHFLQDRNKEIQKIAREYYEKGR